MTATVDMPALIEWALSQDPPACEEGIERARLGWAHLYPEDRQWIVERCGPELLERFARDPSRWVRVTVAQRCGPELLEVLARDPEADGGYRPAVDGGDGLEALNRSGWLLYMIEDYRVELGKRSECAV